MHEEIDRHNDSKGDVLHDKTPDANTDSKRVSHDNWYAWNGILQRNDPPSITRPETLHYAQDPGCHQLASKVKAQ